MELKNFNILVVEDNQDTQILLRYILNARFNLQIVSRVDDAIRTASETLFQLMLVDINLGEERTGVDLLHLIRGKEQYTNTPVIALTAYAMPGDDRKFLASGFTGYVSKPFTRNELLKAIDEAIDTRYENS